MGYMVIKRLFLSCALALMFSGASANDGSARVGTGGIEFIKNDHVRVAREILEISAKQIRVEYHFINESDKDIQTTVAFPIPRYRRDINMSQAGPTKAFGSIVNGHPIRTTRVRKAILNGRDVTDRLRVLGLSDEQMFAEAGDSDDGCFHRGIRYTETRKNYTQPKWFEADMPTALPSEGFVENHPGVNYCPKWEVEEAYYWEQIFPAGREVTVVHEYAPQPGIRYDPSLNGELLTASTTDEACLKDGTGQSIQNRINTLKKKTGRVWVDMRDVEYILGTARTWKGSIGEFILRIKTNPEEKGHYKGGSIEQYVSLCFPGKPKRLNSHTLEFAQKDFVPPDKVVVYFYNVSSSP